MVGPAATLGPTTPAPPPAEEGSHFQCTPRFLVAYSSPENRVIPA